MDSILRQTFRDFELLVIDDGSTDDSLAYMRSLADPRVTFHRLERVGLVEALNFGLHRADAGVIARMDCDDLACETRLEKQYEWFKNHPSLVLLGCDFDFINASGDILAEDKIPIFTSDSSLRWLLLFSSPFLHPGVLFRRDEALAAGGYREAYFLAEDYDLWTRLSVRGKLGNYPEMLMKKRVHGTSVSVQNEERQQTISSKISSEYAAMILSTIDPECVRRLHKFYSSEPASNLSDMRHLLKAFVLAKNSFEDSIPAGCAELRRAIRHVQRRLRGQCNRLAKSHVTRPWTAWKWFRAGCAFDPEEGTLTKLLSHRLMGTKGP